MPPILTQIVLNLIEPDAQVEVVAAVDGRADLEQEVARQEVDVVITRTEAAEATERWSELLFANPRLRLLALSRDARTAVLHRLVQQRVVLRDVSPAQLLDAIRGSTEGESP